MQWSCHPQIAAVIVTAYFIKDWKNNIFRENNGVTPTSLLVATALANTVAMIFFQVVRSTLDSPLLSFTFSLEHYLCKCCVSHSWNFGEEGGKSAKYPLCPFSLGTAIQESGRHPEPAGELQNQHGI